MIFPPQSFTDHHIILSNLADASSKLWIPFGLAG